MQLTPIKVPGKRARDMKKGALASKKSQDSQSSDDRPRKKKPRPRKSLKSRRNMSLLEKLPTELLENIFLQCLNLDLPRSSPVITAKLSSERIYTKTFMAVFDYTWHRWYDLEVTAANSECVSFNAPLQSAILRCRWASLEVILKSREMWIGKFGKNRLEYLSNYDDYGLEHDLGTDKKMAERFDLEFAEFSTHVSYTLPTMLRMTAESATYQHADVAKGCEIPKSLLLGPWTEEMLRHLYWLVKGQATTNSTHSLGGELAFTGMKTAIASGNLRAMWLLFWAGFREDLDMDTLLWALGNAGGDKLAILSHLSQLLTLKNSKIPLTWGFDWAEKIEAQLEAMMEEAVRLDDNERVKFLEDVQYLPQLKTLLEFE